MKAPVPPPFSPPQKLAEPSCPVVLVSHFTGRALEILHCYSRKTKGLLVGFPNPTVEDLGLVPFPDLF